MRQARSGQAPVRLDTRAHRLVAKGHHAHVVTVALARALVGVVGAMATQGPGARERPADPGETPASCVTT
jgi:hypothetical protein